ncbi:peptidyl-prolyl cis-trans isomerase FKBP62-like [Silene latifolia]|uniref:peptidyl-prolyl cis-trans isomerase FKBP62-like n=1 Tax=Silene latifolia TaxID=37657 RepID=UPI003D7878ED
MEYQFLLLNLCDLFVVDDNGVDDDDLAKLVMELGVPSISNLVKDRGNSLFREGDFVLAARHYTQAIKLVCFLGLPPAHDQAVATSLCLSFVLNLAVCELKLSHYNQVCCYCTFVLSFDTTNVKALYRRGLAFKHLNLLSEAIDDFQHAVKFEPHHNDVNRELLSVADLLPLNVNGKRVAYPFNPLASDKKGEKPL